MVTKRLPLEILLGIKMWLAKHEICIVLVHPAWCVRYSIFIRRKRWLFDMIMRLSNTKSRKISPKLPSSTCMSVFYSSVTRLKKPMVYIFIWNLMHWLSIILHLRILCFRRILFKVWIDLLSITCSFYSKNHTMFTYVYMCVSSLQLGLLKKMVIRITINILKTFL